MQQGMVATALGNEPRTIPPGSESGAGYRVKGDYSVNTSEEQN
jgi:hypothetical protein